MVPLLLFALLGTPQDATGAEASISQVVGRHFPRWDAPRRAEVAAELLALWKTLPEGDLRERGLMRIVRTIEVATHLFPRDQEFKEMRKRHPELPVLEVPDRFHIRAYEIAVRKLKVLVANAVASPSRTDEAKGAIADQINETIDRAMKAYSAKAADDDALELIVATLKTRRREFLRAMEDPFSGYQKALDEKTLEELQDKIVRHAEALPKLDRHAMRPPKEPHRLPDNVIVDAVSYVHVIARAYNPARFTTYDEDKALIDEVQADWREQKKKSEKAYLEKGREELDRDRDPDRYSPDGGHQEAQ